MDEILKNFGLIFPEINRMLSYGILIFIRLLGFVRFAPVFNRKEIPGMIKLSFAFIVAVILTIVLKPNQIVSSESMFLQSILNFVFGAMLGWMANCIVLAVEAGGDMINMQMGVSSAQIMDPTTQGMVSLMGRLFSLIGLLLFIHVRRDILAFQSIFKRF
ncbi:MAG: flagellar biosynthetic protein FliR [Candidatus Melainabacteria bacterium]|nr:MAG: flagellar biosynthetic protein FliR [Candidatus Melainabacteria bacterium]